MSASVGLAVAPDGSLLVADADNCRVRRIDTLGVIRTIAGKGCGIGSTGIPPSGTIATEVQLGSPQKAIAGPDGTVYIADRARRQVLRLDTAGVLTVLAGTGELGSDGDGGPATAARLGDVNDIALQTDGSLALIHGDWLRVIATDGTIRTVSDPSGYADLDAGDAFDVGKDPQEVQLLSPRGLASGPDGTLYVAHREAVRALVPAGTMHLLAGRPTPMTYVQSGGDLVPVFGQQPFADGPGQQARFFIPDQLARSSDGSLFVSDHFNHRIRRLHGGAVTTVAGGGETLPVGDGVPARQAAIPWPTGVAATPDGRSLYIADGRGIIWKMDVPLAEEGDEVSIPSEDGTRVFVFTSEGRHLRTEDPLDGRTVFSFRYGDYPIDPLSPPAGSKQLLTEVEDAYGNITRIERDEAGNPVAIVAPFGQRTELELDTNGWLALVRRPVPGDDTNRVLLGYAPAADQDTGGGLLATLEDPRQGVYRYVYDSLGRLVRAEDPASGALDIALRPTGKQGHAVELTTAEGRTSRHEVEVTSLGEIVQTTTDSAGIESRYERLPDGTLRSVAPVIGSSANGGGPLPAEVQTEIEVRRAPDPRFGALVLTRSQRTVKLPRHPETALPFELEASSSRLVDAPDPGNPQGTVTLLDSTTVAGRTSSVAYSRQRREVVGRTPTGRTAATLLDGFGRAIEGRVPAVDAVHFSYDSRGRVSEVWQGMPGVERKVRGEYEPDTGYLAKLIAVDGRELVYEYDELGRVDKLILPDLHEVRMTYDANGNTTSIAPPQRPPHRFDHDPVDDLTAYEPPDLDPVAPGVPRTTYGYDDDHQLVSVTRADGRTIEVQHDSAGRVDQIVAPHGVSDLQYDPYTGWLDAITVPGGTLAFAYHGALPAGVSWSDDVAGAVSVGYTEDGRLRKRSVNGRPDLTLYPALDDDGLVREVGLGSASGAPERLGPPLPVGCDAGEENGCIELTRRTDNGFLEEVRLGQSRELLTYTSFGELDRRRVAACSACVDGDLLDVDLDYDRLGRVERRRETLRTAVGAAPATTVHEYGYDARGRLTEVRRDGVLIERYGYDANGNRTSWTVAASSGSAAYDDQDRLLVYGSTAYTYSLDGELRTKSQSGETITYDYDVFGNLRGVTLADGLEIDYVIDAANRRVGKKVNGSLTRGWLYKDQLEPIAEGRRGAVDQRLQWTPRCRPRRWRPERDRLPFRRVERRKLLT